MDQYEISNDEIIIPRFRYPIWIVFIIGIIGFQVKKSIDEVGGKIPLFVILKKAEKYKNKKKFELSAEYYQELLVANPDSDMLKTELAKVCLATKSEIYEDYAINILSEMSFRQKEWQDLCKIIPERYLIEKSNS